MKMLKFTLPFVLILFCYKSFSQGVDPNSSGYYIDAFTNSRQIYTGGTAKNIALSGTQTALGADLGSLSSNPAGLGVYRKSEVAGSLAFNFTGTSSTLFNQTITDVKPNISLGSLGVAFCFLKDDIVESNWRGGTFSFGMNTLQSFQNSYSYAGVNNSNSAIDSFREKANGTNSSNYDREFEAQNITSIPSLAYNSYLITPDSTNLMYYGYIPFDKSMNQEGSVTTSGAIRSWAFGYGANYKNKLFLGGSVGIMSIKRKVSQTYSETLLNGGPRYLNNFTISENYETRGTGINLTLGAIYRIDDNFRIGASVKTPDYYGIREEYEASVVSNFNNIPLSFSNGDPYLLTNESASLNKIKYNYSLYTPLKASLGFALFLNKAGFISIDGEYVNYKGMLLSKNGSNVFKGDNKTIRNIYNDVINIRGGIELRKDIFRFRGGAAYMPSPYHGDTKDIVKRTVSNATTQFSLGVGLKFESVFIDVSFSRTNYTSNFSPYVLKNENQPLVTTDNGFNLVQFGIGGSF